MTISTYSWDKSLKSEYSSFNTWITAQGSNQVSLLIGKDIVLTTNTVIPSNIDIVGFYNGAKFSGPHTLTINKMSAKPMHQIFNSDVSVVFNHNAIREAQILWWGTGGTAKTSLLTSCSCGGIYFYDSEETELRSQFKFINTSNQVLTCPMFNPLES